jgi:hypothetical protein
LNSLDNWLVRIARRYLLSCGLMTIPHPFVGIVIGCGTGSAKENEDGSTTYTVNLPKGHTLVAISNAFVMKEKQADERRNPDDEAGRAGSRQDPE